MALPNKTGQTGGTSGSPMDFTTITYYTVSKADDMLAVVRYTAYGENAKPVAVCEVTPEEIEPHSDSATWIGENSYDPTGATIVEYEWTLIQKPLGSTSEK